LSTVGKFLSSNSTDAIKESLVTAGAFLVCLGGGGGGSRLLGFGGGGGGGRR
jgi:hypothetical protein